MGGLGFGSSHSDYGFAQTSCSAPPALGYNCSAPAYVPPVSPCYQAYQSPCAVAQQQTVQYAPPYIPPQPVSYASGYPTGPMPAPMPHVQPQAPSCGAPACSSQYSVSPYGYDGGHGSHDYSYQPASYAPQSPSPYAYGTQSGHYGSPAGYGSYNAAHQNNAHFYGTLGAVWYDVDRPYAGLQGRLGYQATPYLGAEIEGSIGVINEVSPFNQDLGGGNILSGEFKDGVDYSAAAFATARVPLSRNISTHARLGYHTTRTFADVDFDSNPDQQTTTTLDGIAYGAGIQMDITPVDAIRADFTRYESDTVDNDSVSLAYLRRF
jgi:hypothetical protein